MTRSPFCDFLTRAGVDSTICSDIKIVWGTCNADKGRDAGLSRGHHSRADREQVEAADPAEPFAAPWRFNELKKSLAGISQKVLTDSLRSMEDDGLVTRTVYPEVHPGWNTP